ncbi:hypothetical protein SAMN06297280_0835 [Arsukibacterium tuosuense]|uniref:DUF5610 domain-containing protein n=1 Tax=Arsukibacterium tuosuense TaxID=1323745 RepID=A0A285IAU9_9GAMM|nr:DUF5610 domain-containing protein [Arsukibacterium tuosuense]SNY45102.1 hypothetical protein SAMN06297280_0835 [Arsukibacterium tuosuense]
MAITPSTAPAASNAGKNIENKNVENKNTGSKGIADDAGTARQAQNVAILKANERVSLSSNNDSLSLLYKTALEGINAELEPVFGENAAQKIYDSGIDTSPEATAERIVAFATSFYSRYKELNPDRSEQEQLDSFLEVIGGGIEKGFADAKDILKGLKVYEGEVAEGVDQTYAKVMAGLDNFRQKMLELAEQAAESSPDLPDDTAEPDNPTR